MGVVCIIRVSSSVDLRPQMETTTFMRRAVHMRETMNIQYTLEHPRGDFHGNPSRCLCKPPGGIISRVLSPDVPRPSTFSRWGTRGKSPVEENQAFGLLSTVLVQHSGWGPPEKFGGHRFNGPLGGPQNPNRATNHFPACVPVRDMHKYRSDGTAEYG